MNAVEIQKMQDEINKKENRVRCFLCSRWVREDLTVLRMFNNIAEPVCYSCKERLRLIDESEEMEKLLYEKVQETKKS